MKVLSAVLSVVGLFLIAGAAGSQDFYEECRIAVDCVAGDPPTIVGTIVMIFVGLILMLVGVVGLIELERK